MLFHIKRAFSELCVYLVHGWENNLNQSSVGQGLLLKSRMTSVIHCNSLDK